METTKRKEDHTKDERSPDERGPGYERESQLFLELEREPVSIEIAVLDDEARRVWAEEREAVPPRAER